MLEGPVHVGFGDTTTTWACSLASGKDQRCCVTSDACAKNDNLSHGVSIVGIADKVKPISNTINACGG